MGAHVCHRLRHVLRRKRDNRIDTRLEKSEDYSLFIALDLIMIDFKRRVVGSSKFVRRNRMLSICYTLEHLEISPRADRVSLF